MKFCRRVLILCLSLWSGAQAQENLSIKYFYGGSYNINFHFDSAIFSGIGLRSSAMGGAISGLGIDPAAVVRHPAAIAMIRTPIAVFDVTPPISVNLASVAEFDNIIDDAVDESLVDYNVPKNDIEYPGLNILFGQKGLTGTGGMIIPTRAGNIGFSINRPLSVSLDILGSGFSTMIETTKSIGDNVTVVQFAAQMTPSLQFDLNTTAASLSYGVPLNESVAMGATVDWMTARMGLNAFFKLDGIMLLRQEGATSGQEYAFNDPFDASIRREEGEQNALDQWAIGEYRGTGWGLKFSSLVKITRGWTIDLAFSSPPSFQMKGNLTWIQNKIPALNADNLVSKEENTDLFNVTELNLAKPTLTKPFVNPTDTLLQLNLPGSLTIGTSIGKGERFLLALNYVQYFGEFSYTYLNFHRGLKLTNSVRLGMTLPFAWFLSPETIVFRLLGVPQRPVLRFGFGVTSATTFENDLDGSGVVNPPSSLFIPSFALGKSFRVMQNVEGDLLFFGLPASVLKLSFLYRF